MRALLVIPGRFPGLNDYISALNSNRYAGNAMKQKETSRVMSLAMNSELPSFTEPVKIRITWFEQTRKRDIDNVCFAQKFILDGLVRAGIIHDDSQKYVFGIIHRFTHDKYNPRIEIEVMSA